MQTTNKSKGKGTTQRNPLPLNTLKHLNNPKKPEQELVTTNKDPSNRGNLPKESPPIKHPPPHLNKTPYIAPVHKQAATKQAKSEAPRPRSLRRQTIREFVEGGLIVNG